MICCLIGECFQKTPGCSAHWRSFDKSCRNRYDRVASFKTIAKSQFHSSLLVLSSFSKLAFSSLNEWRVFFIAIYVLLHLLSSCETCLFTIRKPQGALLGSFLCVRAENEEEMRYFVQNKQHTKRCKDGRILVLSLMFMSFSLSRCEKKRLTIISR